MSEHTKGPWRVHDEFVLAGGEGRGGRVIAMNHDRVHYECEPENAANAKLIAAAPELLFCLKAIMADLPQSRDWLNPDVERMALAAIAKAT